MASQSGLATSFAVDALGRFCGEPAYSAQSLGERAGAGFDDSMERLARSATMFRHLDDLREYHQFEFSKLSYGRSSSVLPL